MPPSEIGHARIAAANAEQAAVVAHIQDIEGFASNEHLLAGRGLERIDHALNNRQDRTAAQIMDAAGNGDDTAINVANMQASFAGAVYGDMALANLPLGGLYLIGGVARALEPYLSSDIFAHSFRDKGRFGPFNEQFSCIWSWMISQHSKAVRPTSWRVRSRHLVPIPAHTNHHNAG